jgi:ubiquinone/menaquinone biosynthesis C-methylase UbiE
MLEIGCNTGLLSIQVKSECQDLNVTALDILEKYVQLGQILEKALGATGVRWIVGDGTRLNEQLKGEAFDLVFLCEILEHFEFRREQEELLNQAVSVCSPGGKVMVSVPFKESILCAGHFTTFDAMMLTDLVSPFAREIMWLAEERVRYNLDKHFFLMFTPKKRDDGI